MKYLLALLLASTAASAATTPPAPRAPTTQLESRACWAALAPLRSHNRKPPPGQVTVLKDGTVLSCDHPETDPPPFDPPSAPAAAPQTP